MSEAGEVRRSDGRLVPRYRILWGGRFTVLSAETLYRMTFNGPFPDCSRRAGVDEGRLDAAKRLVEKLRSENDDLRARFAAFGIDI